MERLVPWLYPLPKVALPDNMWAWKDWQMKKLIAMFHVWHLSFCSGIKPLVTIVPLHLVSVRAENN